MAQINPYLTFDGDCREVMTFYAECLGGSLNLQSVADTPYAEKSPDNMQNLIMHSVITKDGEVIMMASDIIGPYNYIEGTNVSLSLNCNSEEEIETIFGKLAADGKVTEPLKRQFWGALFGVLIDKYNIRWMLNYE